MDNDAYIKNAKSFAAKALSEVHKESVSDNDVFIVWFCKTLQNWKALISTRLFDTSDYVEVTFNGDDNETYVDVYSKNINIVYDWAGLRIERNS